MSLIHLGVWAASTRKDITKIHHWTDVPVILFEYMMFSPTTSSITAIQKNSPSPKKKVGKKKRYPSHQVFRPRCQDSEGSLVQFLWLHNLAQAADGAMWLATGCYMLIGILWRTCFYCRTVGLSQLKRGSWSKRLRRWFSILPTWSCIMHPGDCDGEEKISGKNLLMFFLVRCFEIKWLIPPVFI